MSIKSKVKAGIENETIIVGIKKSYLKSKAKYHTMQSAPEIVLVGNIL